MTPREKYLAGFQVLFGPGIPRGVTPEVRIAVGKRTSTMVRCTIGTPIVGVIVREGWMVAKIQPEEKYVWLAPNESEPSVGSLTQLLQGFLKDKGCVFDLLLEFKKEIEESKEDVTFLDLMYKQLEMVGDTISSTYSTMLEYVTNIPKIFS
jgi:hypothetical protein